MRKSKFDEYNVIQSIMTYSIDDSNSQSNMILGDLGINAKLFFNSSLYKKRTHYEKKIYNALHILNGPTIVTGSAGSGKTTLVSKVLDSEPATTLSHKFDMKNNDEIKSKNFQDSASLDLYISGITKCYIVSVLKKKGIFISEMLYYFLRSEKDLKLEEHISRNSKFQDASYFLLSAYSDSSENQNDLLSWLKGIDRTSIYFYDFELAYNSLLVENLAYYLVHYKKLYTNIVFFFDNVDSLHDRRLTLNFCHTVYTFQSRTSDSINIIATFRSSNPIVEEFTDDGTFPTDCIIRSN